MKWTLLLVACAASVVSAGRISMNPERVQGIGNGKFRSRNNAPL